MIGKSRCLGADSRSLIGDALDVTLEILSSDLDDFVIGFGNQNVSCHLFVDESKIALRVRIANELDAHPTLPLLGLVPSPQICTGHNTVTCAASRTWHTRADYTTKAFCGHESLVQVQAIRSAAREWRGRG